MRTSKIQINAEVNNKKYGHGIITRIITKSTGYVEVRYDNGTVRKEMAFNLTDNEGNSMKAAPKKREAAAPTMAERIQKGKEMLLQVNNDWNHHESNETMAWTLNKRHGNETFESLKDAWFDVFSGKAGAHFTEAQAYALAKALLGC